METKNFSQICSSDSGPASRITILRLRMGPTGFWPPLEPLNKKKFASLPEIHVEKFAVYTEFFRI